MIKNFKPYLLYIKCDMKISKTSYNMLKYLQTLGSMEDIVGKTWRSLGFSFN